MDVVSQEIRYTLFSRHGVLSTDKKSSRIKIIPLSTSNSCSPTRGEESGKDMEALELDAGVMRIYVVAVLSSGRKPN